MQYIKKCSAPAEIVREGEAAERIEKQQKFRDFLTKNRSDEEKECKKYGKMVQKL